MPLHQWFLEGRLRWHYERHRRRPGGIPLQGRQHRNYAVELREPLASLLGLAPGTLAKFRDPRRTVEVAPWIWPDEAAVLDAVRPQLPQVPRELASFGPSALHTFACGTPLSELHPSGAPVAEDTMRAIAELFARMPFVSLGALPPLPAGWPEDKDSPGFLRRLARFTQLHVQRRNAAAFESLFDALGVPQDAMARFLKRAGTPRPRPFSLLHTDLHRDNLVALPDGSLFVLDWERALYGDPLHDLATHLVRMGYADAERDRMIELWSAAMEVRGLSMLADGIDTDLDTYIGFEYAQSVFSDTIRAAENLEGAAGPAEFTVAADRIHRALRRARQPLALDDVPSPDRVESALRSWHRARG